ncbi:SigB/SigF/SigG family RNA polymerase sigma factor [Nocardioides insulae]|uniref:SigB/SigF/SigG family RNA polymerase sigma factor n=1 Tax=Nocardioides insulae TaxID=394734 RepID=UPI0003F83674|nr:SigB/SigF/SigG family RNA polymerase sigma factor [Nocardioides insulae]
MSNHISTLTPVNSGRAQSRADLTRRLMADLQGLDPEAAAEVKERIVEVNMDVARTLARRYYGHGERSEDLDQTAYLGLTRAVGRFDPGRGKDFLAFAVPTILGELRRHFRDACWMVRPPRRVQELQGRMVPAMESFAQEHGRSPDPWELAELLDVSLEDIVESLTADGCFTPASLDKPVEPDASATLGDLLAGHDRGFDRVEIHEMLKQPIGELSEREHRIIELRFFRDWTQTRIAEEIGVTQMQISRILSRIIQRLRAELDDTRAAA